MKEIICTHSIPHLQRGVPIWIVVSLSILISGLTAFGIMVVSDNYEYKHDAYSTLNFIVETPVLHNRRHLRVTKRKESRRRIAVEADQMEIFSLKDHRPDSQHLREILYFLNHV